MKFTNIAGLDEALVEYITQDDHVTYGDISVTQTLDTMQRVLLLRRHRNEITVDVQDMVWMWLGKVGHSILADMATHGAIIETPLAIQIDEDGATPLTPEQALILRAEPDHGVIISGIPDRLTATKTLIDLKFRKVWGRIMGSRDEADTAQLSIYRYMLELHGYKVNDAHITEVLIDHQKPKVVKKDYPEHAISTVPVKLWSMEKTWDYLKKAAAAYLAAKDQPDEKLPSCTDRDRWARGGTWAIYKNGTKSRAHKVCKTLKEAEALRTRLKAAGAKVELEERKRTFVRCESYCFAAPFCYQWMRTVNDSGQHAASEGQE